MDFLKKLQMRSRRVSVNQSAFVVNKRVLIYRKWNIFPDGGKN